MSEGPMPPDRPTDDPPNDDDARDERLAALLEVPPLDDLTRRRLVRRALDEPGAVVGDMAARRRQLVGALGVAAAAVVVVVAGAVVLRAGDDSGDTTAARSADEEPAENGGANEAAAAPGAFADLGEVSDPAVLREQLGALAAAPEPRGESEGDTQERAAGGAAVPAGCLTVLEQAGAGSPTLVAGGTYQGAPALVLVAPKGGIDLAFVLDASTCELRSKVPLV